MNRRLGLCFVAWLAAIATVPLAARADEFLDRMLIMDRSGSMWNRLQDGETRYEVADKLAESLVRSMGAAQPDVAVGVVATS